MACEPGPCPTYRRPNTDREIFKVFWIYRLFKVFKFFKAYRVYRVFKTSMIFKLSQFLSGVFAIPQLRDIPSAAPRSDRRRCGE